MMNGDRRKSRRKRENQGIRTIQTLENSLDGAGAAAAAHRHVELVLVVGHGWVEWDVARWNSPRGWRGSFKKAEVEVGVGDVRRRGARKMITTMRPAGLI